MSLHLSISVCVLELMSSHIELESAELREDAMLFAFVCGTRGTIFWVTVRMTHTPTVAELEFEGLKGGEQRVAIVTGASSGQCFAHAFMATETGAPHASEWGTMNMVLSWLPTPCAM
jgi:hypothetical protein